LCQHFIQLWVLNFQCVCTSCACLQNIVFGEIVMMMLWEPGLWGNIMVAQHHTKQFFFSTPKYCRRTGLNTKWIGHVHFSSRLSTFRFQCFVPFKWSLACTEHTYSGHVYSGCHGSSILTTWWLLYKQVKYSSY